MTPASTYVTRPLSPDTWDDFVALVEANNGVWGGCWCMGFHPEGLDRASARHNRETNTVMCDGERFTKSLSMTSKTVWVGVSTVPRPSFRRSITPRRTTG